MGPHRWHELDEVVKNGVRQFPININTYLTKDLTEDDKGLGKISANYEGVKIKEVKNNGHTWLVSVGHKDENSGLLTGGPLDDEYQLLQYHAHCSCHLICQDSGHVIRPLAIQVPLIQSSVIIQDE